MGVGVTSNLMAQYSTFNGYRMQQQGPYITNTAGFINQSGQIPVQMMAQPQYQDTQNNHMYPYPYINGSLMQPLNGARR